MTLFKTLSGVFQPGKQPVKTSRPEAKTKQFPKSKFKKFPAKQPAQLSHQAKKQLQDSVIREAEAKSREIVLEARDQALRIRSQAEDSARKLQDQITGRERQVSQTETNLAKTQASLETQEKFISTQKKESDAQLTKLNDLKKKYSKLVQEAASLSKDDAQKIMFDSLGKRLEVDMAKTIKASEEKAREESEDKAREIIIDALRHGATDYVAEYTVSTVRLPNEESKGRIIGKEGRNIRAFENATGVDVDLDETPGEVRISCFDPVRREIARVALTRLLSDGRIQPTRIDEYIKKATEDIQKIMLEEGKKLCHAVGVYNLPQDIISMLGKFKYRFSYGQNMIAHTLEETKIGIALAGEVGANVDTVRLGCLLHDIGKVVDEEGSHVELGVALCKKYNLPQDVIDCIAQHHEDEPFSGPEQVLVYVADAISGARPGARYENYEEYVKRLTKLEEISKSFKGVDEAYAIQAGREVRVMVKPDKVTDAGIKKLALDIKERVRNEMTYPGTVTVTVMRETKATEVAK